MTPVRDAPAIAGVPSLTELISDYRFLIHLSDWVAFHTFRRSTLSYGMDQFPPWDVENPLTGEIEYGNRFTWLASLQAREKSSEAMLDAMEILARQVRGHATFPVFEEGEEGEGHLVFRRW
jgi:hypothetical protein